VRAGIGAKKKPPTAGAGGDVRDWGDWGGAADAARALENSQADGKGSVRL
jgi:hypothetical protein